MEKSISNAVFVPFVAVYLLAFAFFITIDSKAQIQPVEQIKTQHVGTNVALTGFVEGTVFVSYTVLLANPTDQDERVDVIFQLMSSDSVAINTVQMDEFLMKAGTIEQLTGKLMMPQASFNLVKFSQVKLTKSTRLM